MLIPSTICQAGLTYHYVHSPQSCFFSSFLGGRQRSILFGNAAAQPRVGFSVFSCQLEYPFLRIPFPTIMVCLYRSCHVTSCHTVSLVQVFFTLGGYLLFCPCLFGRLSAYHVIYQEGGNAANNGNCQMVHAHTHAGRISGDMCRL